MGCDFYWCCCRCCCCYFCWFMFNWLKIQQQMKSGIFGLLCVCLFVCFLFSVSNSMNAQGSRMEPNWIELNRFIWMNKWINEWNSRSLSMTLSNSPDPIEIYFECSNVKDTERASERTTNSSIHLYGWKLDPSKAKHSIHIVYWCLKIGKLELWHNCKYWLHDGRMICDTQTHKPKSSYEHLFIYLFANA